MTLETLLIGNTLASPPMRRRTFLRRTGAMFAAATLSACGSATPSGRPVRRIGVLNVSSTATGMRDGLLAGLRDYGYDDTVVKVDWRQSQREDEESIYPIAQEMVAAPVDVIVANGSAAQLAARRATSTIPIVIVTGTDPIEAGLIESLARPGGNVTGIGMGLGGDVDSKRLELLKEAFPRISRVAVVSDDAPERRLRRQSTENSAHRLGMSVVRVEVHAASELPQALNAAADDGADSLLVIRIGGEDPRTLVAFAAARRIPAAYGQRAYADAGGLLFFAVDLARVMRRVGNYVARILNGEPASALPLEQPTHFHLEVNLKTAREQGLTIPRSVLAQATRVIE